MDTLSQTFRNISQIVERESKSSTYKFALLRGTIDIIQECSPYTVLESEAAHLPLGRLVEKWIIYYYPILESQTYMPQINGNANRLSFNSDLERIIDYYRLKGGFSAFYQDLQKYGLPEAVHHDFISLTRTITKTIVQMPMKYIGTSINNSYYSIFSCNKIKIPNWPSLVTSEFMASEMGTFIIPDTYYEAFRLIGSFINGRDSILFKWAEFSVNASKNSLSINSVLNEVLKHPITDRQVQQSIEIYKSILNQHTEITCVWTDTIIRKYDIDHVIPFSVWHNNDLWNLLPSTPLINNKKRNRIPTPALLNARKDSIINYWNLLYSKLPQRFEKEFRLSLIGNYHGSDWLDIGIASLQKQCDYLITDRGFEKWDF